MKSINKKKLLNILMIVIIAVISISGVMAVGNYRGWFADDEQIVATGKLGNANIEREGIAYSLTEGTALAPGDSVNTLSGSTVTIEIERLGSLVMGENTQITVGDGNDQTCIAVESGEVFADITAQDGSVFELNAGDSVVNTKGAVFSLSVPAGSRSVFVFDGGVDFTAEDLSGEVSAQAGQTATLLADDVGGIVCMTADLSASALNDFLIEQVRAANDISELCFTDEELDAVLTQRQEEIERIEAEREAHEKEIFAEAASTFEVSKEEKSETDSGSGSENTETGSGTEDETASDSGTTASSTPAATQPTSASVYTCTISIHCETILNNMGNLTEGKAQYVPASGVILSTSTIEFSEGETVFDVLKRACSAANLQIEYSYFPIYESYYIEGINHLYEFDCGTESGWMYKVNGWFPNYGCSAYTLEAGDAIVWCYTCNGLGADVGASMS